MICMSQMTRISKIKKKLVVLVIVGLIMVGVNIPAGFAANLTDLISVTLSASSGTVGNAFDTDNSTYWRSSNTSSHWVKMDFGNSFNVNSYSIKVDSSEKPSDWVFEGSIDGINWSLLDTRTNITIADNGTSTFSFSNLNNYQYYRLYFDKPNVNNYRVRIDEIALFGPTPPDKTPPVITLSQEVASQTFANVNATVADTESGVAIVKYLLGTKAISDFSTSGADITSSLTFVALENGVYTVYAKDLVGNEAVKTINVTGIKGALAYDKAEFVEVEGNNGQIENQLLVTLSGGTFKNETFLPTTHYSIGTIPSGLTFKITRVDNTTLKLSMTGTAAAHEALNSAMFNLTLTNNAYNGLTATTVVDNTKALAVRFVDSPRVKVESGSFIESDFNDGSIAGNKTMILTGANLTDLGVQNGLLVSGTHYTVSGVPVGLTVEISKESDTRLAIKLSGKATNHAAINSISNMTITLNTAAFDTTLSVSGRSNTFAVTFIGKNPIRILEIYPSTIFTTGIYTGGDYKDAAALSTVDYKVTSMSLNKFISLKEDINGLYDVVYFGRGRYAASIPTLEHYGNDITNLAAEKIKGFIASGQLVIFHNDALTYGLNNYAGLTTNMVTKFKPYTDNPTTYTNVVKIANQSALSTTLSSKANSVNSRPILSMLKKPFSYKSLNLPLDKSIVEFTFIASDKENSSVNAKLYIDRDNDGLFKETEIVETHVVNRDRTDTFYYTMPTGLTGVYFWKLIVTDAEGASSEVVDVFYLKGDQINVNVLQIIPNSNKNLLDLNVRLNDKITGTLATLAGYSNPADSLGYKYGEYKINVTVATVSEFNTPPTDDPKNLKNLNGNYDMILFGFADVYGSSDFNQNASDRVKSFLATKQSVMFTHDMIMFDTSLPILKSNFLSLVGQATNTFSAAHIARSYTGNTSYSNYNLSGYAGYMDTGGGATTSVSKVNSTAMSLYPFDIETMPQASMQVAKTHYQYYKLDLENPDLIPVFNLYRPGSAERYNQDAMNNYYTYSIGNMTYSGTGHSGGFPDYELMMFVNTMIKAYSSSNHAPNLVVYEPVNNAKLDFNQPKFKLAFRAYDYDDGDEEVYYKVFIDKDNNGNFVQVGTEKAIQRGTLTELDITKPFSNIRSFKIKVEVRDDQNAKTQTEILLFNTDIPKVTPEITINDSVFFVGESLNVHVTMSPSGKVIPNMDIDTTMDLNIPAGVRYNGVTTAQTINYLTIPTFKFTETGSTTPTWMTSTMTMAVPVTQGIYTLMAKSNYTLDGQPVNPQPSHQQSFTVVQGQVEIQVVDSQGNPMKNVQIFDKGVNTGQQTLDGGRIMLTPVSRGEHIYTMTAPSGYIIEKTEYGESLGTLTNGNKVTLTNTAYAWKVKFTVKLNITVPITYYHVLPTNDVRLIGSDDGTGMTEKTYDLRTKKGSMVRIAALVDIPLITGNEIKELSFEVSTQDKFGNAVTAEYQAKVVGSVATAWPFSTATGNSTASLRAATSRLIANNTTPPGGTSYAGHKYYVIIEIPKADTQKFWISKLNFKMSNNSVESIYNSKVSVISIKDLSIPVLK